MFGFELDVLLFIQSMRTDLLNMLFQGVTMLGEEIIIVLLVAVLYFCIDKLFAQKLLYTLLTSIGINGIVKNLVKFPRPFSTGKITCVREGTATGYSFPSGHTQSFATTSTTIAKKVKKVWVAIIVGILIALVAFSRLYLGAHYPSDVVVGAVVGITIAIVGSILFDKIKNKKWLYLATILIELPFVIFFLITPDVEYEDFFKAFGMIVGFLLAVMFEEKHAPLEYNIGTGKKVLRVLIGVALALIVKERLKLIFVSNLLGVTLLLEALRYGMLIFATLGIGPWIFKKLKI